MRFHQYNSHDAWYRGKHLEMHHGKISVKGLWVRSWEIKVLVGKGIEESLTLFKGTIHCLKATWRFFGFILFLISKWDKRTVFCHLSLSFTSSYRIIPCEIFMPYYLAYMPFHNHFHYLRLHFSYCNLILIRILVKVCSTKIPWL